MSGRVEPLRPEASGGAVRLEEGDGGHQAEWAN
jgi:hypothetical protein